MSVGGCIEVPTAPGRAAASPTSRTALRLILAAAAVIWLPVLNHLRLEWMVNEQYRYGFLVPVFALYLTALRWADRPEAHPLASTRALALAGGVLLFAFLPLMLVEAANPDWRVLSWLWTSGAVALTSLAVLAFGGWPWLRHFVVPLTFIFVAVPWPMSFETRLVQDLMQKNAAVAVEILHWFAIPVAQEGNVIRVGAIPIEIDRACSGVRSLQTSLMAGWLLGELHRLAAASRLALVASCVGIALFWNVLRTLALVSIVRVSGSDAMAFWHDYVGYAALVVALVSWILLGKGAAALARPDVNETWILPGDPAPEKWAAFRRMPPAGRLPRSWCWLAVSWVALCFVAVEIWYFPTRADEHPFEWTVRWPSRLVTTEQPISAAARGILKYSRGTNRTWEDAAGNRWSVFHLQWDPGRTASALAHAHRPDICLPAAGRELQEDRGAFAYEGAGVALVFRHFVFNDAGRPLHVFFSLAGRRDAEDRTAPTSHDLTRSERFRAVLERRRNEGQQQLELGIWGIADAKQAERALHEALREMLRPVAT